MAKGYQPRQWKTTPCSNCGQPVKITKPSRSGLHYCTQLDCQRAKSKQYHKDRAVRAGNIEQDNVLLFIHALAHRARMQCPSCGLANALPGYKHPTRDGLACAALGENRMGKLGTKMVDAVWPSGTREYAEVQS